MRLPSIRLPFLKRKAGGGGPAGDDGLGPDLEGDLDGDLDDAPVEDTDSGHDGPEPDDDARKPGRLRRILVGVATGLLAVVVIGGAGGLLGWLLVNAEHTESARVLARPQLTVPILAEGEVPEPNSSAGTVAMAKAEDGQDSMAKEGQDETGGEPAGAEPDPGPADGVRLAPVDPALIETKDDAQLPIIGVDGRQPWTTYARPFNLDDTRPRIAVVIINLGLGTETTRSAIHDLPGAVTLSFSPYARDLPNWIEQARRAGHETFIDLPMEPLNFPRDDPGPSTLLTSLSLVDNLNRLEWVLGRAPGYVGVTTWMGSQFTTVEDALMPVLEGLKERGLMILDSRATSRSIATELASSIQLPRAFNNQFVDEQPSVGSIDRALAALETTARQLQYAVGIAHAYPVTLDRISRWLSRLEAKGFALAPVSAIADRQRLR